MAFTDREKKLAEQVKKQGGSRQDFLELLEQMRASQIKTPEFTPTQDPSRKGISIEEIQEIGEKGKTTATEVKTPDAQVTEIETEEPKGKPSILWRFVSAGMAPFREDDKREKIQVWEWLTELPDITGKIKDVTWISVPDDLAFWAERFISDPVSRFAKGSKEAAKDFTTKATWEEWALEAWKKMFFNILPSLWAQWAEIIDTIANPVDTAEWMINLAEWIGQKAVWGVLDNVAWAFGKEMKTESEQTKLVDQIGKDLVEQYWTPTKFKKAFIENPALVLEVGISALKKWGRGKVSESDLKEIENLEKEAKIQVDSFLKPTKDKTSRVAEKINPEILKRRIKGTRDEVLSQAEEQVSRFWEAIELFEEVRGVKGVIKRDQLLDILDEAAERESLFTEKLAKKRGDERGVQWEELDILAWQEAKVKAIKALWDQLSGLWDEIPLERMIIFKRAFDQVLRWTDASLDAFQNQLRVELGNEIRKEISKANPELALLNKEFSFYKWLETVLEETQRRELGKFEWGWIETKRTGQITSAWTWLWGAIWGLIAKGFWWDAALWLAAWWFLWRQAAFKLDEVMSSPKWKITSAQKKKNLADALARWDAKKTEKILDSIIVAQSIKIDTILEEWKEETESKEERKKRLLDLLRPKK